MKGVILAGGNGTRLWPLTEVTNKHLISVGKIPMIEYPLHTLDQIGLNDISIVTGGEHFQNIAKYLGKVHPHINLSYHIQLEAGGIAQALSLVKYQGNEKIAVILGDNIFEEDFSNAARYFENSHLGAMLFLKRVEDPQRFGVAEILEDKIINIEEKPKKPRSDLAVTGLYFYDSSVFEKIKNIKISERGEYEITDVNNMYLKEGRLGYHLLEGFWKDAGTHESRDASEKWVKDNYFDYKIYKRLESVKR